MYVKPHHVIKIFELTELHMEWFKKYHKDLEVEYVDLFKRNLDKINYYIQVDKLGQISDAELEQKINKMFNVYYSLFEITEANREFEFI